MAFWDGTGIGSVCGGARLTGSEAGRGAAPPIVWRRWPWGDGRCLRTSAASIVRLSGTITKSSVSFPSGLDPTRDSLFFCCCAIIWCCLLIATGDGSDIWWWNLGDEANAATGDGGSMPGTGDCLPGVFFGVATGVVTGLVGVGMATVALGCLADGADVLVGTGAVGCVRKGWLKKTSKPSLSVALRFRRPWRR